MIFARNEQVYDKALREFQNCDQFGMRKITELNAPPNPHGKEHFGFKDGITQPILPGLSKSGRPENTLATGEFILGYKNGYDQFPDSPLVSEKDDPLDILPASEIPEYKDFGKNGSYMVFRQITQDVELFWNQAKDAAEQMGLSAESCVYAATKMMGRWPDGQPISRLPDEKQEIQKSRNSYFLYREEEDQEGFKCPLGAHIRRTNPRDVLPDNNGSSSVKISNLHRLLRRGRTFGSPLVDDMDPVKLMDTTDDGQERGLYFICFNANIARQFEFVQHMWCNNPKFAGQYNDPDPVLGSFDRQRKDETHDFTVQAKPVRKKVGGLKPNTHVTGGAYFFMPGLRALKYLANQ
jgi:Dyp-type peroxidase family